MAKACLCVLLRLDYSIDSRSLRNFPLAEYAAYNFDWHAEIENVVSYIRDGIDRLFDAENPHFAAWLWMSRGHRCPSPQRPEALPLYYIVESGLCGLMQHLISRRPQDLNTRADKRWTLLHVAVDNQDVDVSQILLGHRIDVDVRDFEDRTPLHLAAHGGSIEIIRVLIQHGANINIRDKYGQTPLFRALDSIYDTHNDRAIDRMRFLLEHGADVDARNNDGQTPLHRSLTKPIHVSSHEDLDIIRILLEHGADVSAQDVYHTTPLHLANSEVVQILLDHGTIVHIWNSMDETPFQVASAQEVIWLLSEHAQSEG